jgi:sporulation protein YlmC with PRC-barrel domain
MLQPSRNLMGYTIAAMNGEIGKVVDFYFDKISYTIRYLVVETGSFLFSRKILLSTELLLPTDWEKGAFVVNLRIDQIENCPHVDYKKPISSVEEELKLMDYYKWGNYRNTLFQDATIPASRKTEPLLHSINEVSEFDVYAIDGKIGRIRDVLTEDKNWSIRFLIIDAFSVNPAKEVLVLPTRVQELDFANARVKLSIDSAAIQQKPEFFPDQVVDMA